MMSERMRNEVVRAVLALQLKSSDLSAQLTEVGRKQHLFQFHNDPPTANAPEEGGGRRTYPEILAARRKEIEGELAAARVGILELLQELAELAKASVL